MVRIGVEQLLQVANAVTEPAGEFFGGRLFHPGAIAGIEILQLNPALNDDRLFFHAESAGRVSQAARLRRRRELDYTSGLAMPVSPSVTVATPISAATMAITVTAVIIIASTDPAKAKSCMRLRRWSFGIFLFSLTMYLIGFFFAFIAVKLM